VEPVYLPYERSIEWRCLLQQRNSSPIDKLRFLLVAAWKSSIIAHALGYNGYLFRSEPKNQQ